MGTTGARSGEEEEDEEEGDCLTRAHERGRAARVSAPPTLPRLPRQDPGLHLFFASTRCEGLEDDARRISATASLRDDR